MVCARDVRGAAKERTQRESEAVGQVVSELARYGIAAPSAALAARDERAVHGFQPFGKRGTVVTNEFIDKLREGDIY